MKVIFALMLTFAAFASNCSPTISMRSESGIILKEGHDSKQTLSGVYLEMDQYCPGETVTATILIKSRTAIIGEHIIGHEINTVKIQPGQIAAYFNFTIVGDNNWNEDREFSIIAINPSHGHILNSTIDFSIKNDDPKISISIAPKVTEPRKNTKSVTLKVKLSMPAEQRITGEVEFSEQSAHRGIDFEAPFTHGFEILPGESEFEFLPNTLVIYSDTEKEKNETLRLFLNGVKNATPSSESELLVIADPQNYKVTIHSTIKAIAEARVAMISDYSVSGELNFENENGLLTTSDLTPTYKHVIKGMPGTIGIHPGLIRLSAKIENESLSKFRMEFIDAPYEIYPYMNHKMYLFMSSFGKLHEDEFITIKPPTNNPSQYPAFDLTRLNSSGDGGWSASYKRNLSEGGVEALREDTTITVEEI